MQEPHNGAVRKPAAVRHLHLAGRFSLPVESITNYITWEERLVDYHRISLSLTDVILEPNVLPLETKARYRVG